MTASLDWVETAIRLLAAAGFGAILGLEREIDGQDAGFRTHILLALGAALFGVTSVGAFDMFITERSRTNVVVDVSRIASYVAAGIGFIGGGAMIKQGGVVKGVTTAASIWATAAIGLASGLGFWRGAVTATAVALVALAALQPVSRVVNRLQERRSAAIVVRAVPDVDMSSLIEVLTMHGDVRSLDMGIDDGTRELRVRFWTRPTDELVARLADRSDVVSVQRTQG